MKCEKRNRKFWVCGVKFTCPNSEYNYHVYDKSVSQKQDQKPQEKKENEDNTL